jgi:hypothetical protein
MKTKIKDKILDFMKSTDTSDMSSNEFVSNYLYYED